MQKNKRWLVVPLLIILILPIICVPASAAGANIVGFSPILWSYVKYGGTYNEFCGNYVGTGINTVTSEYLTQVVTGPRSPGDNAEVEFHPAAGSPSMSLTAYSCLLDTDLLDSLCFLSFQEEYTLSVSWSFTIADFTLINNEWQAIARSNSGSAVGYVVDLAPLLKRSLAELTDDRIVVIQALTVDVEILGDEFRDDFFVMSYNTTTSLPLMSDYTAQLDLTHNVEVVVDPANPNEVSFVDWLKVAVGGFLDFQLWPGFTLNQLIEFVVVIGLVLWFITLMI